MSALNTSQPSLCQGPRSSVCITGAFRTDPSGNERHLGPQYWGKIRSFWSKKDLNENKSFTSKQKSGGSLPVISLIGVTKLLKGDQLGNNYYFCGSRHLLPFNIQYSIFLN